MQNKDVDNYANASEFVPDSYIDDEMRNKVVYTYHSAIQFVPKCYKLTECVIKLLILVASYLVLSLINIRLNRSVIKVFPKNLLC